MEESSLQTPATALGHRLVTEASLPTVWYRSKTKLMHSQQGSFFSALARRTIPSLMGHGHASANQFATFHDIFQNNAAARFRGLPPALRCLRCHPFLICVEHQVLPTLHRQRLLSYVTIPVSLSLPLLPHCLFRKPSDCLTAVCAETACQNRKGVSRINNLRYVRQKRSISRSVHIATLKQFTFNDAHAHIRA